LSKRSCWSRSGDRSRWISSAVRTRFLLLIAALIQRRRIFCKLHQYPPELHPHFRRPLEHVVIF
jgi:hypothetical protein